MPLSETRQDASVFQLRPTQRVRAPHLIGSGLLGYLVATNLLVVGCSEDPHATSRDAQSPLQQSSAAAVTTAVNDETKADAVEIQGGADASSRKNGSGNQADAPLSAHTVASEQNAHASETGPPCQGWDQPVCAILLSGEQHGFIEPCGCSLNQLGGLTRRADLARQLRERDWDVIGMDVGGLVSRNRRQSQIKFETMITSLAKMGYVALALGPEELRLGPDYLLSQDSAATQDPPEGVSFLSANAVFFESPDLPTPARTRMVKVNGLKIGITGVIGADVARSVYPEGAQPDVTFQAPEAAIDTALAELQAQNPDLLVLLAHATRAESRKYASQFKDFDIVLTAGGPEDPDGEPEILDGTWLLEAGHKGKHTGVLAVYPNQDPPFRFELVDLDRHRFDDDPDMIAHMKYYQERLREEQLIATELPIPNPSTTGATYVGAEACQDCHTRAYEKWLETPHSHAYDSLVHVPEGRTDFGIARVWDAECVACHVVGWDPQRKLRYKDGWIHEEFVTGEEAKARSVALRGVQCESCHGPGSKHIDLVNLGEVDAAKPEVRVTLEQSKDRLCYECHDLDNSPGFEFDSYWDRVAHPWSD